MKTTIFLRDFSDYGNAGATAVPDNLMMIDIAPLSFAFETTTTAERMCALMSHEFVHVATPCRAATCTNSRPSGVLRMIPSSMGPSVWVP